MTIIIAQNEYVFVCHKLLNLLLANRANPTLIITILIVVFYRGLYNHDVYTIVVTAKSAAEPAA